MPRLRELGFTIGRFPTGAHNAITDVPAVLVGHSTLLADTPRIARTGVTLIVPRNGDIWHDYAFAGYHSFNGNGEMTGIAWLEESGMLGSPIGLTNTHQVGLVRDTLVKVCEERGDLDGFLLPVVAETYDGVLNDINAFHVQEAHVREALANARGGAVAEGNVGGGTGMICHEFKGGIGTSSRLVQVAGQTYTLGVLVQANYGLRPNLRLNGIAVGEQIPIARVPAPWKTPPSSSSIIVIIATDAPLLPVQCKRLARRATIGLARVGGSGYNSSGDLFLAFSTGNHLTEPSDRLQTVQMVNHNNLNDLFDATADATEEAIWNAMTSAETMVGYCGHQVYRVPIEMLLKLRSA
ncbi:MAG TPA: P1 family peptidase [Anaerolineales bacterium]|nr:P1 family peptidase [Anaerolineales bacterium]